MTQRLLRFAVAQCFQGPTQLSLDFLGRTTWFDEGRCANSALEKDTVEKKSARDAIYFAVRRIIATLHAAEYSLPGHPHR